MAAPLLQTRDLSMRFGGVQAVRNVNFTLAEGELRCLIGPNGAGKSTFFKMLTGQLQPSQGQVLFRGNDISRAHAHQIARLGIGIKTQVPSVFDGLSVRENIWLAASRIHSAERISGVVDEMLERMGLTGAAKRLVGQLAHGQRQWVELGIVLSTDPERGRKGGGCPACGVVAPDHWLHRPRAPRKNRQNPQNSTPLAPVSSKEL